MMNWVAVGEQTAVASAMSDRATPEDSKAVKSAARALDILELLGRTDKPMSLTEIAGALGLPKSSTYHLLQTLVRRGYLESNSRSGPFLLGLKVVEVAGSYIRRVSFLEQFPTVAGQVVAACQETVQLAVLDGAEVVYLAKQDGTRPVRLVSRVGSRLPAHATALGKVLLAALPDAALNALFPRCTLVQMTPRTIATLGQLKEELSCVRAQGHALDDEETVEDLQCFAAPVRDFSGKVVAAISVSVPKSRVAEGSVDGYVTLIKDAAHELSQRIGCSDHPWRSSPGA